MAREVPRWQAEIPGLHHRAWEPSRAAVASLLASADAYVTAGPHETFGLSVLEAQACGLPVLGVRAGALAERVDEGCGWLVPPDDVEALAAAMGEMATLPKGVLEAHGRAGRARAVRGGGWEATFRRLFALYGLEEPADAGGEEGWSRAEARAVGLS
jgi:alpha-1,6-mannosyltransferase